MGGGLGKGSWVQDSEHAEGTLRGRRQAEPRGPGSPTTRRPRCPAALTARGQRGQSAGRDTPGHSPPAQGAPACPGSRSLQVNPEKGTTRECQSAPLTGPSAQVPGPEATQGGFALGRVAILSGGHCERQSCHTFHSYLGWGARLALKNDDQKCPAHSTTEWGRGHADRILGPQTTAGTDGKAHTDLPPTAAPERLATVLHGPGGTSNLGAQPSALGQGAHRWQHTRVSLAPPGHGTVTSEPQEDKIKASFTGGPPGPGGPTMPGGPGGPCKESVERYRREGSSDPVCSEKGGHSDGGRGAAAYL